MSSMDSEKNGRSTANNLDRQITMSLSSEQYERLFIQPSQAKGDAAQRYGNPSLLGVLGFLVPFGCTLFCVLELRGSNAGSLPAISGTYFMGGIAMVIAGIFEFILGNTYPMSIFIIYGAHWINTGYTNQPMQALTAAFDVTGGLPGALSPEFNAGQGHYSAVMAMISFIFLCGSPRTNVPYVLIFIGLVFLFSFFAAAFYSLAANPTEGGVSHAYHLLKLGGGFGCLTFGMGLYAAIVYVTGATGMPCPLPIMSLGNRVFPNSPSGQAAEHAGAVRGETKH